MQAVTGDLSPDRPIHTSSDSTAHLQHGYMAPSDLLNTRQQQLRSSNSDRTRLRNLVDTEQLQGLVGPLNSSRIIFRD